MPYITQKQREMLFKGVAPENPGQLNYLITNLVIDYVMEVGLSYQAINDVSGALTEAAAEFRRRVTVPYENRKAHENGDVYPLELTIEVIE